MSKNHKHGVTEPNDYFTQVKATGLRDEITKPLSKQYSKLHYMWRNYAQMLSARDRHLNNLRAELAGAWEAVNLSKRAIAEAEERNACHIRDAACITRMENAIRFWYIYSNQGPLNELWAEMRDEGAIHPIPELAETHVEPPAEAKAAEEIWNLGGRSYFERITGLKKETTMGTMPDGSAVYTHTFTPADEPMPFAFGFDAGKGGDAATLLRDGGLVFTFKLPGSLPGELVEEMRARIRETMDLDVPPEVQAFRDAVRENNARIMREREMAKPTDPNPAEVLPCTCSPVPLFRVADHQKWCQTRQIAEDVSTLADAPATEMPPAPPYEPFTVQFHDQSGNVIYKEYGLTPGVLAGGYLKKMGWE